jgi:hypothetical protein
VVSKLGQTWEKGHRSGPNDNCLEARYVDGIVEVRDDKDQTGPVLRFTRDEWLAFTGSVRDGQFDLPA